MPEAPTYDIRAAEADDLEGLSIVDTEGDQILGNIFLDRHPEGAGVLVNNATLLRAQVDKPIWRVFIDEEEVGMLNVAAFKTPQTLLRAIVGLEALHGEGEDSDTPEDAADVWRGVR